MKLLSLLVLVLAAIPAIAQTDIDGNRTTNELRIESALDPLRDRADFKKLVAELVKNSPSQQEKK